MNIVNFESISEAAGNHLIYSAGTEYDFDRIAVKMLASDLPFFLAPVKIMNMYDRCVVKYEVGSYRNITSLKMRMSKKECCTLIRNLLYPMIVCGEWFLDYHKFCLQKDCILCDTNTFDVRYIYILEKSYFCSDEEIMNIFRDIFKNTDITDDKDFRIDLLQALLDDDFSINSLYEMVADNKKNKNVSRNTYPAPAAAAVEKNNNIPAHVPEAEAAEPVRKPAAEIAPVSNAVVFDDDSDDMVNLFPERKKNTKPTKAPKEKNKQKADIFGGLFGKTNQSKAAAAPAGNDTDKDSDYTVIAGADAYDGSDETNIVSAFLNLESSELSNYPSSVPIAVKEGGTVTIGRKSSNPDIVNADIEFPADCTKISRKHCSIRMRDGIYSICDLDSGNGTFVDGRKAENGVWIELQNGSVVMFGNKVAVYSMQINT